MCGSYKLDPTFLMADAEIVATYELYNINRAKLENLIHRIFDAAIAAAGRAVFAHACRLGAEGIVSKRIDSPYRSGRYAAWIKVCNPASLAVQRERVWIPRSSCAWACASR